MVRGQRDVVLHLLSTDVGASGWIWFSARRESTSNAGDHRCYRTTKRHPLSIDKVFAYDVKNTALIDNIESSSAYTGQWYLNAQEKIFFLNIYHLYWNPLTILGIWMFHFIVIVAHLNNITNIKNICTGPIGTFSFLEVCKYIRSSCKKQERTSEKRKIGPFFLIF